MTNAAQEAQLLSLVEAERLTIVAALRHGGTSLARPGSWDAAYRPFKLAAYDPEEWSNWVKGSQS